MPLDFRTATASTLILVSCATAACSSKDDGGTGQTATKWEQAFDASTVGWLMNTCGPAEDDAYMVGGSTTKGAMMHFDGTAWSPVTTGIDTALLNWCHGFAKNDVTVVGSKGTVLHFDGASWTKQATPTDQDLWGVWGAAPNDMWSVGGDGLKDDSATLLHFDGAAWTKVELPKLQKPNVKQLLKVWGTGADNVYAVGQAGVVIHYSGGAWKEELVGATDDLVSLWGTGPSHIVAVGGRANGIASVWDGAAWKTTALAPLPGLNGVWMRSDARAYVAGAYGTLGELDLTTMKVKKTDVGVEREDFHSVFGDSRGRLFAVGGNLAVANPSSFVGLAYTRMLGDDE